MCATRLTNKSYSSLPLIISLLIPIDSIAQVANVEDSNTNESAVVTQMGTSDVIIPPFGPLDTAQLAEQQELASAGDLRVSVDYQALAQKASDSLDDDFAAGGVARLLGTWSIAPDTSHPGALVLRAESRHRIGTDLAPQALGPVSLGYAGLTGTNFSDQGFGIGEFYWKQQFLTKTPIELRVGKFDMAANFDVTGFSDPYTSFVNLHSIFSPTVPYPAAGSLGALGFIAFPNKVYLMGALVDANGEFGKSSFDTFEGGEYFTAFEFGISGPPPPDGYYAYLTNSVHVSYWHQDGRKKIGTPSGQGVSIAGSRWFDDGQWVFLMRAGWSEGGLSLLEKSASFGVSVHPGELGDDYAGLSVGWGQAFDSDEDQVTTELFYRFQLNEHLAVTPNLQLIVNPANNSVEDKIWVFGVRVRVSP